MKLNKEDWKKLDELLSKIGFGGYYDLVECLKTILRNLPYKNVKFYELADKESSIEVLVKLILLIQRLLKRIQRLQEKKKKNENEKTTLF